MKKRRLLAMFLAFIITLGVLPIVPFSKVNADTVDLNVTKKIDWDTTDRTKANITVESDVPDLTDTKVLFIGTMCGSHSLSADTIESSLNAIAKNADVDYYLLNKDSSNTGYNIASYTSNHVTYYAMGSVSRYGTVSSAQKTTISSSFKVNSNHSSATGMMNLINDVVINKKDIIANSNGSVKRDYDYDYIVFEFDGSRVAADDYAPTDAIMKAVAQKLQTDFYAKNKVIWITDGSDGSTNNPTNRLAYVPSLAYYSAGQKTLKKAQFRKLTALFAPSYYLSEPTNWNTTSSSYYAPSAGKLSDTYKLELGQRTITDYVNGVPKHNYKVYPHTARQLWYNNAEELADFLYMAIEGATLEFEDNLKVSPDMDVTGVHISVRKKAEYDPTQAWIKVTDFDVTSATPQGTDGSKYVEDNDKNIKITTGNTDPSKNNQIDINVHDLKNQLANVQVILDVKDPNEFVDSIEIKMDPNDPDKPLLDKDGNYQYIMNPNDGPVNVTAYQDGTNTKFLGEGKAAAEAPPMDGVLIDSTVTNGTDNYDTTTQTGQVKSTTPLQIRVAKGDRATLTYTPATDYGMPDIKIAGSPVTLDAKGSASTDAYDISTDASTGVVTVFLKKVTTGTAVDVAFKNLAPVLDITKVVKSPTVTPVPAGSDITYEITVTNSGLSDATGVKVTDKLDTSLISYKSSDPVGSYDAASTTVTWDNLTVAAGDSVTLTLVVTVNKDFEGIDKKITNVATCSYKGKNIDSDPADTKGKGKDVTFIYNVENKPSSYTKPDDAVEVYGTTMSDENVAKATVSPVPQGYTFSGWYADSSYTEKFDFTKKITSTNYTITAADKINIYGKFTSVKSFDIVKSVSLNGESIEGKTIECGSTVTYTILVKNTNPVATIQNIVVEDAVPAGLENISNISNNGSKSGSTVKWTIPELDAGSSVELTFDATVPTTITDKTDYKNVAAVKTADGENVGIEDDVVFSALPNVVVDSSVTNGTDDFDTSTQKGKITGTDPLQVTTSMGETTVFTYTPDTDFGAPDIKIDGTSVTLDASGAATGTTLGSEYSIKTDPSTGVVTVTLPKITKNRSISVAFKDIAPVLDIKKTITSPSITPVVAGNDVVYSITVTNSGLSDATGVKVTDKLDTSLVSYKSTTPSGSYDATSTTVTWDNLTVPAKGSVTLTLVVTVKKDLEGIDKKITNVATCSYKGKNTDSDPANIDGTGRDITFTYTTEGTPAGYTKPADFTEVYGTTISSANAAKATVSPVPAGYTFSGWYADSSYSTEFDFDKKITSSNYTITAADKVNIYGKFTSIKSFKVTKSVTFNGSSVEGGTVSPGSTVTYTVKVENTNPAATITDIEVVDTLPSGLTIDPNTISDGGVINGNKITWTIQSLSAGSYKELTFNATVPSDIKVKTDYKNTAAVKTAEGENVDADDDVTFSTIPDKVKYTVGKTFSDTWDEHKTETVNVEIYQNGTAIPVSTSQKYIELTYTNQSANVFLDPYDSAGNPYTYVFKEIDPETNMALDNNGIYNKNYKVTYTVDSSKNTTTIDNGYVITAKDLDFKKVADDVVKSGNEITYTLTVKNKRVYETATDIEVTDDLPDGVTVASVGGFTLSNESKATSNDNATDNSGVVTWTIEKLEPGCTATLVIKVIVDDNIDAAKLVNVADITKVGGSTYKPGEFPSPEAPTDVRTFTVTKEWVDTVVSKDDHSAITVELYRSDDDTTPINTATLDKNNNWTYKWTGLKMYDANSQLYVYTVKETEDAAFTTKYDYSGNASGNTSAKITNTRKSYEINYAYVGDTPAGKATPTPVTKYNGEKYDAATKPTETNYVFDGWFTDSACTTQYTDGTTINDTTVPGGTLTLYGKWTRKLEVSYEYKGTVPTGAVPPASDYVLPNAKYDAAPTPSEKNYVFDGWFTDPGCTKAYTDGTEITKDTVLYGLWAKMPQVSYKYVGEDIPADVKVPDSEIIDPRVGYDAAEKPSKLYYVFDGWFLDPDCKTRYTDGTKLTDDTVLYGNWKRETAPVKPQPGNGPGPDPSLPVYPPESNPKQGDSVPVPPDPTYNGNDYRFGGWFADPDCTIPYTPTVLGPDGLNIYAKWDKNPTAYYTFNGKVPSGAKLPPNATMLPGTPYNAIMPEVPSGYKFDGWYLDPQMTIKFKDGMKIDADTYLYGQWIALDPVVPTGDNSCMGVWAMLTLVSCAGFVYLFGTKKRYVR